MNNSLIVTIKIYNLLNFVSCIFLLPFSFSLFSTNSLYPLLFVLLSLCHSFLSSLLSPPSLTFFPPSRLPAFASPLPIPFKLPMISLPLSCRLSHRHSRACFPSIDDTCNFIVRFPWLCFLLPLLMPLMCPFFLL